MQQSRVEAGSRTRPVYRLLLWLVPVLHQGVRVPATHHESLHKHEAPTTSTATAVELLLLLFLLSFPQGICFCFCRCSCFSGCHSDPERSRRARNLLPPAFRL